MFAIVALIISVILTVLSYVLRPKPKKPEPNTNIEVPEIRQGKPIPVVFGTRFLNNPNVVWYGDVWIISENNAQQVP
jgi:hypothetical protein